MRRRHLDEHENHERWLVSYADFITLLFAFFVVMYAISSVNEGKYKVLSDSLVEVFNQPQNSPKPIQIGEPARTLEPTPDEAPESQNNSPDAATQALEQISNDIQAAFGDLIKADQLTVRGNEQWVEIELNSSLLFSSGDAVPNEGAFAIIEKIAKILAPFENPVHVEGFTDNIPISTGPYPSNWELSTARAASIVRLLAIDGVRPGRLAAVGYGQYQPIADNATAEGRARNRRVILVVSRNLEVRRSVSGVGSSQTVPETTKSNTGTQPATQPKTAPQPGASVNSPASAP